VCTHCFHKEEVLGPSEGDQRLGLRSVDCETLLAQDSLASGQRVVGTLVVVRVGSTDVNNVDVLRAIERDQYGFGRTSGVCHAQDPRRALRMSRTS
jgi:hypothetical protein